MVEEMIWRADVRKAEAKVTIWREVTIINEKLKMFRKLECGVLHARRHVDVKEKIPTRRVIEKGSIR
jgi:hypothetical protein